MRKKRTSLIKRTLAHSKRFQEIIAILIRYGFTDYITFAGLDVHFRFIRRRILKDPASPPENTPREQLVRMALEEMGPTFIKLGQLLSNRPDIVPPEMIQEFSRLQDTVQPIGLDKIEKVLAGEFKKPLTEIFSSFNPEPLASASIGQVHTAVLANGIPVAIKIQKPDITEKIEIDLDILHGIATLLQRNMPETKMFQPIELVNEFRSRLEEELDFKLEASHMEQFRELFIMDDNVKIPKVYHDYCTPRVLTMELLKGRKLASFFSLPGTRQNQEIAQRLTNMMLSQVFEHGYFHADCHPGNILILDENVIGLLDYGLVSKLRPKEKRYLSEMLIASVHKDPARLSTALLRMTNASDRLLREHIEDDVYDILEWYVDLELKQLETEKLFAELVQLIVRKGITVPPSLLLFSKTLLLLEGIVRQLAPEENPLELFEPFVREKLSYLAKIKNFQHDAASTSRELGELLQHAPRDAKELVELVKHGRLRIHFLIEGMEPMRETLDSVSYRIVFGLLLASVIISSSVVIHASIPPLWHGIPVFGILGFVASGIVGIGYLAVLTIKALIRLYHR